MSMRARTKLIVAVTVLVAAVGGRHAEAQSQSLGTIIATVADTSGAVMPGAQLTIASEALIGGPQTLTTADDGTARYFNLPAGSYHVEARADGFRMYRRMGIRLEPGASVVVDVALDVAGPDAQVVVEAAPGTVDVRSPASPVHLDQAMLFHLPTQRDVTRLINLAPGVSADVSFGASQRSNALAVDGTNITDPLFQDPQVRLNQNWIEHVHIAGLGAAAEYGGTTGVVANSVLRSGGNRVSGLGELWTVQPGWLANNTRELEERLQTAFASRRVLSWWEGSGQMGGPIRRDRLWYFTGLQAAKRHDVPAGYTGPGARDEREWQWLGKVTSAVTPGLRIEGFVETGADHVTGEWLGPYTPLETSSDVAMEQTLWAARAYWTVGGRTLVELRHGGYDNVWTEDPRAPNTRQAPYPIFDRALGVPQATSTFWSDQRTGRLETVSTISHLLSGLGGTHDLKAGLELETMRGRQAYGYPGGQSIITEHGVPVIGRLWPGDIVSATTRRWSMFLQDGWSVGHVTVSAGLRVDANRGSVPGVGTVFSTTPVSPRIGLAWDVRRNHRTVARFHYGRYHDQIFASRITQADVSSVSDFVVGVFTPTGEFQETSRSVYDPFRVGDDLSHSGVDQYVLGIDHQLPGNIVLTAQGIARRFSAFLGMMDEGSAYTPLEARDPGPDGQVGTADDGALLTVYGLTNPGNRRLVYANPPEAYNRYNAVQFVARRRFDGVSQMQASYTWSRNEGTVGNRWHVNAARFDLGLPGRFWNPNSFINAFGRATFDPTHEVKVLGTIRVPWFGGANVSGVYRYTTGNAWGRRARVFGLPQGFEAIRVEPQGTRRADAINRLDLRAEKTFRLGGAGRTVGVFLEGFNLSNQGVPDSDTGRPVDDFSGPNFGKPITWTSPRQLRAAVRYTF